MAVLGFRSRRGQVHFCRQILHFSDDLWGFCPRVTTLYKHKGRKTSSVASIFFCFGLVECESEQFVSFLRLYSFYFQTELMMMMMMKREQRERGRFLNLWRFTPLPPSFFTYILPSFLHPSFLVRFSNLTSTHRYLRKIKHSTFLFVSLAQTN